MEQLSIQKIDKKWQDFWSKNRIISKKDKKGNWTLKNKKWLENITSGSYLEYYKNQYK